MSEHWECLRCGSDHVVRLQEPRRLATVMYRWRAENSVFCGSLRQTWKAAERDGFESWKSHPDWGPYYVEAMMY